MRRAETEVGTTHLAFSQFRRSAYGFVDPKEVHPKWKAIPRSVTATQFLAQACNSIPVDWRLFLQTNVPPQDQRYAEMVRTLARYKKIQSYGGWKRLPNPGAPIGPGSTYKDLELLKARLQAEGDLPAVAPNRNRKTKYVVDQLTSDALKSFQFRHGNHSRRIHRSADLGRIELLHG